VFVTGFSVGAMFTYALSTNHQSVVRAAVAMAPANYNIYLPTDTHLPIPWMGTTGMSDSTCPWQYSTSTSPGARFLANSRAEDNGCTVPGSIPLATTGSKALLCYDFQGCRTGYPVRVCTFDGTHQCAVADGGTADNGQTSWIPVESWKFFTQF
jgi:hypothetical protein